MQQTSKYKLNKPGVDDPIAIAPLNENTDKIEAAIQAEISARATAIQAEASARSSADTSETNARTAAIQAEAKARASADTTETNARTAAIQAEANTRANADTTETNARIAADNALRTRIQALEAKRIAYGTTYAPNSQDVVVTLSFTPYAVLIHHCYGNCGGLALTGQNGYGVQIVTNGFKLSPGALAMVGNFNYIAFG